MSDRAAARGFGTVRGAIRFVFKRVLGIYFREVEIGGEVPRSDTGGRIFAANHVNALVDPILVLTQAPCPISPVAKSTLWKIPGLTWLLDAADAVPIVRKRDDPNKTAKDNDAVFERVGAHLADQGNILIFPEGTSHNEPHLAPLKTGAGRMLAAASAAGARGLTFQAVGLEFDARDVFRSRALVVYGPVRDVDALAATSDDLPRAVTRTLEDDLSALIILGPTWDERVLVARVAELFASEAGDASLAGRNAIGREVEAAKRTLKATSEATHDAIARDVSRYYAMLAAAGERDERVARGAPDRRGVAHALIRIALLPLVAAGALLYALPYQVPRLVARALAPRGEVDVVSTYKLGTGLLVFPLWASALVVASFVLLPPLLATLAAAVALASPFAALDALDRSASRGRRSASGPSPPALRATRDDLLARLKRTRQELAALPGTVGVACRAMDTTRALALTIHLIGISLWVGTLFALAALLVTRDAQPEPEMRKRIGSLARGAGIGADVGATVTLVGGLWMLLSMPAYYLHQPWMHMKLTAVVAMLGVHGFIRAKAKRASTDPESRTPPAARSLVLVLSIAIIALVVFKPLAK